MAEINISKYLNKATHSEFNSDAKKISDNIKQTKQDMLNTQKFDNKIIGNLKDKYNHDKACMDKVKKMVTQKQNEIDQTSAIQAIFSSSHRQFRHEMMYTHNSEETILNEYQNLVNIDKNKLIAFKSAIKQTRDNTLKCLTTEKHYLKSLKSQNYKK